MVRIQLNKVHGGPYTLAHIFHNSVMYIFQGESKQTLTIQVPT